MINMINKTFFFIGYLKLLLIVILNNRYHDGTCKNILLFYILADSSRRSLLQFEYCCFRVFLHRNIIADDTSIIRKILQLIFGLYYHRIRYKNNYEFRSHIEFSNFVTAL